VAEVGVIVRSNVNQVAGFDEISVAVGIGQGRNGRWLAAAQKDDGDEREVARDHEENYPFEKLPGCHRPATCAKNTVPSTPVCAAELNWSLGELLQIIENRLFNENETSIDFSGCHPDQADPGEFMHQVG
jgi:hypothetical protein